MARRTSCWVGLLGWLSVPALAEVPVNEVEQYYANPAVFAPVEATAHAYATRFPSFSASGDRLAYARNGQGQIVVRNLPAASAEVVSAPGLVSSGRDFTLSYDGGVLSFASEAIPDKGSCGRQVNFRNMLTGSRSSVSGAACLDRPSKPVIVRAGKPYGYASNIRSNGAPSPSNSYDLYFRRSPPPFGKGDDAPECLTCDQDPNDDGTIVVSTFADQPISNVAHRENRNLWISPGGNRLAFAYTIAYQTCAVGDPDCGESGLVIADVGDSGISVRRSLRIAERNRFLEQHGSADGNRIVLSTTARLLGEDTDDDLDIYLYEVQQDRLTLLSAGLTGSANDPRISGNGRFVLFTRESIARELPEPPDVEAVACPGVFDPVSGTSEYHLIDLTGAAPRRAQVLQEPREYSNLCVGRTSKPREGADINHSGTRIALTTRSALAAGDSNDAEDVYTAANHFARDLIFDHTFD